MLVSWGHHPAPAAPADSRCTGRAATGRYAPGSRRSDDPAPAPLTGLPAGDGPVLADDLDLPQAQARAAHGLLRPGHPRGTGRLGDLVLGPGLLDEDEAGRAVGPA